MKKFLISIDTEGDNLWSWKPGDLITTENARSLYRFQALCDDYGFKPTYLTNYEMAISEDYQKFVKTACNENNSEIGMHLHAWNSPPSYYIDYQDNNLGAPYLIEYPVEEMDKKIQYLTDLLNDVFCRKIVTHRAGRWAMNDAYFSLLKKHGYQYDCSVTPHVNWESHVGGLPDSKGTNYTNYEETPYYVDEEKTLLEIPVSIKRTHSYFKSNKNNVKAKAGSIYRMLKGEVVWLRPTGNNTSQMMWLIDKVYNDPKSDYVMFMLHSSELMPGGSPSFIDENAISNLYKQLNDLFKYASHFFTGATIGEYGDSFTSR